MTLAQLEKSIKNRSANLAVIGLGYVGLPVAALFAQKGFKVTGVDIKQSRTDLINQGVSPIEGKEPGLSELIASVVDSGNLKATTDYQALRDADIIMIDVETPVNQDHIPEYHALRSAVTSLAQVLKKGALIIVESTVMPGTLEKIVLPIIEKETGYALNKDFFLGNCPERVMPGKLLRNLRTMSRVAGGGSEETARVMVSLYSIIVEADVDPADWITAEIVKTAENTYRDVQIAFANEVALISEALGADVWKVRELVRKSPGREMLFPGAGVGGHCIPKDPWLLASSVRDLDVPVRLIPAARDINTSMPAHMFALVKQHAAGLKGKKVLILGYAYLHDSDDDRNSPSAILVDFLKDVGAEPVIHDPFIKSFQGDVLEMARGCVTVVLMTAHSEYQELDLAGLVSALEDPLLIDGRNVIDPDSAIQTGLTLVRLGDTSRETD